MNIKKAISEARKQAKFSGEDRYIVFDDRGWERAFDVCTEYDLDTCYRGCEPIYVVEPDGSVTS